MRQAQITLKNIPAGILEETENGKFTFCYNDTYQGPPISLTMPTKQKVYLFDSFPPFFDGLLPEGPLLEALLRVKKMDRNDLFSQLLAVGADVVGAISITPLL